MVKLGCTVDGNLNEAKFGEPLPWIGLYIAAASLACAFAMAADIVHGSRHRKFWFPSKFSRMNATSLTVIAVAIKLSVDLNTPMPRRVDQLTKLSSGVLICTLMGNSMPSLGIMESTEICMNMIALGILVITVVVNICIQLGTGVIYLYWKEHALTMFIMLVLLVILSFSALTVPITKRYLEFKYKKKYDMATEECLNETDSSVEKKIKHDLMKYWMMAHTCSPQFVMGRSVTCAAAGALCLLSATTLAQAVLRSYLMDRSFKFCSGESDYKWSTIVVLISQTIAVGVGTFAPAVRWFAAINFRCPTLGKKYCTREFKVERYWIESLVELKECPLTNRIRNRHFRKLAHGARIKILDLCIGVQIVIVMASKVIRFISVYFMSRILLLRDCCKKLVKLKADIPNDSRSESQPSSKRDLSRFVLHLEGETALVDMMMRNNRDATDHWIKKGKKKQPKHLIKLLEKSSRGFQGVGEFDSEQVPSLDCEEPSNCWALPVVTLTVIAIAIPSICSSSREQLMRSVHEGLIYAKHIEENLDKEGDMTNVRKAAYVVWQEVDFYHKWLDVDLDKLSFQAESPKEILEGLADAARNRYMELKKVYMKECLKETPSKWPTKVLAANSMYRVSRTLLQHYEIGKSSERLFEAITIMISDILGACLTNVQRIITLKCSSTSVEMREESVRHAVFLLGETDTILKLLNRKEIPTLGQEETACIDKWRSLHKLKNDLPTTPSSTLTDAVSSDLHLTVE